MAPQKAVKIGRWRVPKDLFEQYVRLIGATERSGGRYEYDFDKHRQIIHSKILEHVDLMVHTQEYREFQRALQDACEDMLPGRFPQPKTTKLNPPIRGLRG